MALVTRLVHACWSSSASPETAGRSATMSSTIFVPERSHGDRADVELLRAHELQEALHDPVETLDLVRDHVEVVLDAGLGPGGEPRLHELEMDAHRVERVLHLVRHPRGEAAERRQLLRVGHERLHGAYRLQVSQCED